MVDIDINYNEFDLVRIDIFCSCLPTRIIASYRPPSSDTSAESVQYILHFIDCLTSLCNIDSSIVIIGDLNCLLIDWSNLKFVAENERCSTLFSIFSKQHCFEQLVGESTYLSPSGNGSLLNVILCNDPLIISDEYSVFLSVLVIIAQLILNFLALQDQPLCQLTSYVNFLMLIRTLFVTSYNTVTGILHTVSVLLVKILLTKAHKCHWKGSKAIYQTYIFSLIISRASCSYKLRVSWTSSVKKWSDYVF